MFSDARTTGGRQVYHSAKENGLTAASTPSTDNIGFNVSEYWRLAVKHRILIVGAFVTALAMGIAATLLMTPIYTAKATVQIDREAARVLDSEDLNSGDSQVAGEEFFQTQYGLLKSRSLAERVIDSLGLASSDAFLTQMGAEPPTREGMTAAEASARRREMVLQQVQANFNVAPVRGSRLVNIEFDSPNPALSARVVNAFAENFIQSNLDRKFESSGYAREFLEERIAQTKAKLEDAERQLVAYAGQQEIINISEGNGTGESARSLVGSNLSALNDELATARAARVQAEQKWRQAQAAPLLSQTEVLQNVPVQRLMEERARLDARYQQNSQRYQEGWPEQVQLRAQIDELDRQIRDMAGSVRGAIRGEYEVALNRERVLQAQVNRLKGDVLDLRERSIQYNILLREVDTSRTLYDGLLQRYKEVGVTGGVTTNNISIVDRADAPNKPSKPNLLLNLMISALLGLGLGILAAFILEALDESLATPDDVETKLGTPVLGVVPLLDKGTLPMAALGDIRSPFSEAYYSLRTALQFSTENGTPPSLLVTSSRPAEGKSTTSYATALNLARIGKRVLLIDGDLRNPSMHRLVGADNDVGMSNLLSNSASLEQVARPTQEANLWFIPCGPLPPNPAELLGGDHMRQVIAEASDKFDHVVIDGPPVLGFADAPVVASMVAGTIFVLESKGTKRAQARGALRRMAMGNGRLLGIVLTKFNTRTTQYGGYDYAYDYTYGGDTGRKKGR